MRMWFTKSDPALGKALRRQHLGGLGPCLIGLSALVAVTGCIFAGGACAAPTAPDLTLTVRVYNYAQTPSTLLAEAEHEASRILGKAGLNSVWLNCPIIPTDISQNPCPEPMEATDIQLRILSEPAHNGSHDTAYGFAVVPALASVYSESTWRFARNDEGEFEAPILLGCTIAHEIGHLMLGLNSHSASGVMCAHWERKHIRQALMGAMVFTPEQARLIQTEMRRRMASEVYRPTT